jgi:hypothetical protein
MLVRSWVNILLLMVAAYGTWNVGVGKSYMGSQWQYYFYLISPWALLYGAARAWHRCHTWRRMTAAKCKPTGLSRGQHRQTKVRQRPGILEYACAGLFLLAAATIFQQLENNGFSDVLPHF